MGSIFYTSILSPECQAQGPELKRKKTRCQNLQYGPGKKKDKKKDEVLPDVVVIFSGLPNGICI